MRSLCLSTIVLLCAIAGPLVAAPFTYTGSLSVADGGLTANGPVWNNSATTLTWTVDDVTTPGMWHYSYTLVTPGPQAAISHMIVEASDDDPGPAFTSNNLQSPTSDPAGWIASPIEIGSYSEANGNPNMPETMYGIKFNAADDYSYTTVTISFDSDRSPVWGDFYAKCGGEITNTVYNAGFADPDPLAAPSNGSLLNHLLVPDSTSVIPAPGALVLAALGVGLVGRLRRRHIL